MSAPPKNPPGGGYGNYIGKYKSVGPMDRYSKGGMFSHSGSEDNEWSDPLPPSESAIHKESSKLLTRSISTRSSNQSGSRISHSPLLFPEPDISPSIVKPSPLMINQGQMLHTRQNSNPFYTISNTDATADKKLKGGRKNNYGTSIIPSHNGPGQQGGEIIVKDGIRLVESAEIRLEALSTRSTYFIFSLPYICIICAICLALSSFGETVITYPPGTSSCVGSSCSWTITEAPTDNSFFKLVASFIPDSTVSKLNETNPSWDSFSGDEYMIGSKVEVQVPGESGYETVYTQDLSDSWQIVKCIPIAGLSDKSMCDDVTMIDFYFDGPGLIGRFEDFRLVATFSVAENETGTIGSGGEQLVLSSFFKISFESVAYNKTVKLVRQISLGLALAFLLIWFTISCLNIQKHKFFTAERIWITTLLFGFILWLNPVLVALIYIPISNFDSVLFMAGDCMEVMGENVIWLSWVIIITGQRFTRFRDKNTNENKNTKKPYAALSHRIPHHHPSSEYFVEFIFFKMSYAFLACVVGFFLSLLRHPSLIPSKFVLYTNEYLSLAYLVTSVVAGLFIFGWIIMFMNSSNRTGKLLKVQPYMSTRRQQLSYRVISGQIYQLVFLFFVYLLIQVCSLVIYTYKHVTYASAAETWKGGFGYHSLLLLTWARGLFTPLGMLLFMSCIVLSQVFIFLPPHHSVKRRNDRLYVSLEKDMPMKSLNATNNELEGETIDLLDNQPLFCLETACFLCEAAWQAYYDPFSGDPNDLIAPAKQDLSYLGLSLVSYIYNEETEMRAMLFRGADRLILAFRGTAHVKNLATDLKMTQTSLPQFAPKGRKPIVIPFMGENYQSFGVIKEENEDEVKEEGSIELEELFFAEGPVTCFWHFCNTIKWFINAIPFMRQTLPLVHSGFLESYMSVREQTMAAVARELQKDYKPLYITGHSLGGALACLAAHDITANYDLPGEITLYTYGSPIVGNGSFARLLNSKVPHHFHIVNDGDLITRMPQFLGIYIHAGTEVVVDSDKCGNFIVEPTIVERAFGVKPCTLLTVHPLGEYRECIEACMGEEDLKNYISKGYDVPKTYGSVPNWLKECRKKG